LCVALQEEAESEETRHLHKPAENNRPPALKADKLKKGPAPPPPPSSSSSNSTSSTNSKPPAIVRSHSVVDGRHESPVRNLSKELAVTGGHAGHEDKGHESSEEDDVETESPSSSLSDSDSEHESLGKARNAADKSRELLVVDLDDEDAIAIRLLDLAIQAMFCN